MFVAAIDFGTTYSGYSFVIKKDVIRNQFIALNGMEMGGAVSLKVPTTVLLDEKKKFVDLRYKVEEQYAEIAEKNIHTE